MYWNNKLAWAIAFLLLIISAVAIACSATGWNYWPERFSHFQIQYWLIAVTLALLTIFLRTRYPILIGLFCIALLSAHILTWYIPASGATTPFTKVLFANVWAKNQNYAEVLQLVRAELPDFAAFAEVTAEWKKQLDTLKDILPYSTRDKKGELIYSKISLAGTEIIDRDPRFVSALIIRKLKYRSQEFTLVASHPSSPSTFYEFIQRNKHLEELGLYLEHLEDNLIVVGDFNTSPWSPYYRKFAYRARLVNARQGFGINPSWTTAKLRGLPGFLQPLVSVPIDHIFTRSGTTKLRATSFHTGSNIGSDHLPVIAEIGIVKS
jgi:endonuclease/exonuclease/phosphatase (EEP) superfamily protein YafD